MSAQKLQTIVEEISNLSVLQLAEITKMLEEKFGVSASMPMMAAAPAGAAVQEEAKEEKTEFKVELLEAPDKIKAIKAIRTVKKDLGLTEAKQLVESAPCVIAEAASKDDAKAMKEALEAAGAKVKLS